MKLKIVYGSPCSGKSTFVKKEIGDNDIVYDYDEIARALTYGKEHLSKRESIHQYIIDFRLLIIKRLREEKTIENAWFISSFLTEEFKEFVKDLEPEYIKMDVTEEECLNRLEKDSMRPDKEQWKSKIKEWFEKYGDKEVKRMPPKFNEREYRNVVELKPVTTNKRIDTDYYFEGYAATWERYLLYEYDGVKYYEQIDRNAFDEADMSDVIMQYDHSGKVFARNSNNTLIIEPDEKGLFTAGDLSKSEAAREMHNEINEGLVTKMSWAFTVAEESYNSETRTRTILKVKKVYDVSAVSIPANDGTDISARAYLDGVIEKERQELLEREKRQQDIDRIKLKIQLTEELK